MIKGQIIGGRYRLLEFLGAGGFGETWQAEDTQLPGIPKCVVKRLKLQSNDPFVLQTAKRLFDNEAIVLNKLGHLDKIPKLFAHIPEHQEFYIVQEFVEGHDLTKEIKLGIPLSEASVVKLLQDILEILTEVHQQGVIHRDIKPANLMRRASDGKIILIDFGAVKEISTLVTNNQGQIQSTIVVGTPGYMPREQSQGYPKYGSDIYAVGMVAIEALTGVKPSLLPTDPNTLEVIWKDRVSVSQKLAIVLDKMMLSDWKERYQSAEEALKDLPITSGGQSTTPDPKHRFLIALISLGIVTSIAVAALVAVVQNQTPPSPKTPTSSPNRNWQW